MGIPVKLKFSGMNNKARPESLPENKARNAVGCLFSDDGEIIFPNPGRVLQYSGNCHSIHKTELGYHFVEAGSLKLLGWDNSVTVLRSGMGISPVSYTTIADTTYFANESAMGKIKGLIVSEWGVARPPRQPDATAVTFGGMFGGEYRIAITYLGSDGEESGTGAGKRVTVVEGGGIHLTNFPTPPSYATGVCVYVSSVNSKDMYLYGEFAANISEITLTKRISTIPLSTQFAFSPMPTGKIISHLGRIYYKRGNKVYWTNAHNYGLQRKSQYFQFDSEVKVILSAPPTLYVNTAKRLYQITNVDSPDGSLPQLNFLQTGDAVPGSEASDADGVTYYCMTDRGFLAANAESVQLLSFNDCAIPFFDTGTMSYVEIQGLRYLIFTGQGATANPLTNSDYQASEIARASM